MIKENLKKVIITGGEGRIGRILRKGLKKYSLITLDKKKPTFQNGIKIDIAEEYERLSRIFKSYNEVIHLAWDSKEDFPNEVIIPENKIMAENIYRAAIRSGVKRVIIASSVHADDYSDKKKYNLILPNRLSYPDTPYGATKIYIESLGKYFARKYKIEVICIRFGGINSKDEIIYREDPNYDKVWLSSRDCVNLIKKCIEAKKKPSNFLILYGVSDNINRIHNISNPFGWKPKDGCKF